jgi:hypothetical protein
MGSETEMAAQGGPVGPLLAELYCKFSEDVVLAWVIS